MWAEYLRIQKGEQRNKHKEIKLHLKSQSQESSLSCIKSEEKKKILFRESLILGAVLSSDPE